MSNIDKRRQFLNQNANSTATISLSRQSRQSAEQSLQKRKTYLEQHLAEIRSDIDQCDHELKLVYTAREEEIRARAYATNRLLNTIRKRFNNDPDAGIKMAVDNRIIQNTHREVAQFLFRTTGLRKDKIGEFLGERDEFAIGVLKEFTKLHDFKNVGIVEALRSLLASFRLPGEGQKIDRIVESFADHYQNTNPNVLANADVAHVLAYAIVMLNTSLHNKNVARKSNGGRMTCSDFCSMVTKSLTGPEHQQLKPPSEQLLTQIYENVKNEPFRMPEDQETPVPPPAALNSILANPEKSGMLYKQGGNIKTWKRRYFVLHGCCLYYFENETDPNAKGIIPLDGLSVRDSEVSGPNMGLNGPVSAGRTYCFEIFPIGNQSKIRSCKSGDLGRFQEGNHRVYRLCALTANEKFEWISALNLAMNRNNNNNIINNNNNASYGGSAMDVKSESSSEQGNYGSFRKSSFQRNALTLSERWIKSQQTQDRTRDLRFRPQKPGDVIIEGMSPSTNGLLAKMKKGSMSLEKLTPDPNPKIPLPPKDSISHSFYKRGQTVQPYSRKPLPPLPRGHGGRSSQANDRLTTLNGVSAVYF